MCRYLMRWSLLLPLTLVQPAFAQQTLLVPVPETARIRLIGPFPLSSQGPLTLADLPVGEATLVVSAPGFAAARARLVRGPNEEIEFREWSGPSALLQPPGFAHLRRSEPRGWLHLGAWTVAGLGVLVGQQDLRDAKLRLRLAEEELALADSATERRPIALEVGAARDEEFDLANVRDLWATYLVATWLGAGIEAWWLTPRPRLATNANGDPTVAPPTASGWKTAAASFLVPGAGQRSLGHERRGNLFGAAVMLSAAGAIVAQDAFLAARRERSHAARVVASADDDEGIARAQSALRSAETDADRLSTLRYAALGTAIVLHAWNVLDGLWLGSRSVPDDSDGLLLGPHADGVRLAWTWNFDTR